MFKNRESYFNYSLIIQLGAYSVMMWTEADSEGQNLDLGADLPKGNKRNVLCFISCTFGGLGSHFYNTLIRNLVRK